MRCCARAGTFSAWSFGDDGSNLVEHAWTESNSGLKAHPVGTKKPNAWGFFDLYGNVWEWCDCRWFRSYEVGLELADPVGPALGGVRVLRGGSVWRDSFFCRSASRDRSLPANRGRGIGFRVAFRDACPLDHR